MQAAVKQTLASEDGRWILRGDHPDSRVEWPLTALDEVIHSLQAALPDVILYGCTSATLALGPEFDRKLRCQIEELCGTAAVTAAGAVIEALRDLSVRRIGFCSPYVRELNEQAVRFLGECGFEVVSEAHVDVDLGNYGQGALTPDEVYGLVAWILNRNDIIDDEAVMNAATLPDVVMPARDRFMPDDRLESDAVR